MTIKFKRDGKYVTYSEDELHTLSRERLKTIKGEIQSNIEQISTKKEQYKLNNDEEYNSKEYLSKMAQYKSIAVKLKNYITYINHLLDSEHESELIKNEHWLWCFYMNVKNCTRKGKFEKLIKATDERAEFHVDIGE